ncbi:PHD and RING finger domain-containing protein 1-like [Dysidea avara]|uniref:PHD and RING finger domain-containing protein 1-like n=1 Tax=Dysidea avara TaxID=196820 RepID=UPI003318A42B
MATRKSSRLAGKVKRPTKESSSLEDRHAEAQCCTICLGNIKFRGKLSVCRHQFCYTCIFEWSKNTNTCPLCKKRFRCITRVCVACTTPPRQVRVPDKNGYHDNDDDVRDDDDVVIDDIRGTIVDYLSRVAPHLQSSRVTDEYDYGDSFIDDSQLTSPNPNHWSSVLQSPSPRVHSSRRPRRADTIHSELQSPSPHSRRTRSTSNNTTTSHWDNVQQSPSPQVHDRIVTRRDSTTHIVVVQSPSPCLQERTRRAYLLDHSDTEELPQSSSTPSGDQHVDDYRNNKGQLEDNYSFTDNSSSNCAMNLTIGTFYQI